MLRNHYKSELNGQVIVEYSLVIGAVILVMFAMSTLIKRGAQSMVRTAADQIGVQENAEQKFDDSGHLVSTYTSTRAAATKDASEFVRSINYTTDETIRTTTNAVINLGFTEEYN